MSRAGARRIVRPPPILRPDLYLRALALVVLLLWSIPASFRLGVPVVMCVGGWCSRPRVGLWRTAVKYKPPPCLIGEIMQTPPLGSLKYTNATTTTKNTNPPYLIGEIIQPPPLGSLKYTTCNSTKKYHRDGTPNRAGRGDPLRNPAGIEPLRRHRPRVQWKYSLRCRGRLSGRSLQTGRSPIDAMQPAAAR